MAGSWLAQNGWLMVGYQLDDECRFSMAHSCGLVIDMDLPLHYDDDC